MKAMGIAMLALSVLVVLVSARPERFNAGDEVAQHRPPFESEEDEQPVGPPHNDQNSYEGSGKHPHHNHEHRPPHEQRPPHHHEHHPPHGQRPPHRPTPPPEEPEDSTTAEPDDSTTLEPVDPTTLQP